MDSSFLMPKIVAKILTGSPHLLQKHQIELGQIQILAIFDQHLDARHAHSYY